MPRIKNSLISVGINILAPAVFYTLIRSGLNDLLSALIAGAFIACPFFIARFSADDIPIPCLCGAAGAVISGTIILPMAGGDGTAIIGMAITAAGYFSLQRPPNQSKKTMAIPFLFLAVFIAAAIAALQIFSFLIGNSIYAFSWFLSSLEIGAAGGLWIAGRALKPEFRRENFGPIAALCGLGGIIALRFIGFIGINASNPLRLYFPIMRPRDIVFIAGQSFLAFSIWSALAAAACAQFDAKTSWEAKPGALLLLIALPLLGLKAIVTMGASSSAALFNLLTALYGLVMTIRMNP
ncbi:MAG: hypothetical protein ACYCPQ_04310 [Elusimicrobiota bacterium]